MRRRWRLIAVVATLLAAGAVYAWVSWPRDATAPASIGEALSGFRSHAGDAQHRRSGLPKFGVYLYETHGNETLETVVLSSTHRYHGRSTITVEPVPCGIRERWQVLTTRWNESTTCLVHNGLRAVSASEHHEFFGSVSAPSYPCQGSHEPRPQSYRIGLQWTIACGNSEGSVRLRSTVVAFQTLKIDGERVPAFNIRSRVVFDGEVSGASIMSDWRRPSDGLLLRRAVDTKASVAIIGGGNYDESYSLAIVSTAPHR